MTKEGSVPEMVTAGGEEQTSLQRQIDGESIDNVKRRRMTLAGSLRGRLHVEKVLGFADQHLQLNE